MNKKAIWDDLVDVFWSFCVVAITLFVFGLLFGINEKKLEDKIKEKDLTIEREEFLMNYLRTPVSQISFLNERKLINQEIKNLLSKEGIEVSQEEIEEIKSLLSKAIEENSKISDLISLSGFDYIGGKDYRYIILLKLITKNEPDFKNNGIWVYINDKRIEINKGLAKGKSSTVEIPVYYSNKIKNIKVECKYHSK